MASGTGFSFRIFFVSLLMMFKTGYWLYEFLPSCIYALFTGNLFSYGVLPLAVTTFLVLQFISSFMTLSHLKMGVHLNYFSWFFAAVVIFLTGLSPLYLVSFYFFAIVGFLHVFIFSPKWNQLK